MQRPGGWSGVGSNAGHRGVDVAVTIPPAASLHTAQVSEYSIFYEFVDGALLRRMQPNELSFFRSGTGDSTLLCLHSLSAASRVFGALAGALNGSIEVV